MLFPIAPPMIPPAWRCIWPPPVEVRGRLTVIAHGDSQDEHGDNLWSHNPPRPVVPFTRIPIIILVDPVQPVVKKEVRLQSRCIVNRVTRYNNELRICRHVDAYAYVR